MKESDIFSDFSHFIFAPAKLTFLNSIEFNHFAEIFKIQLQAFHSLESCLLSSFSLLPLFSVSSVAFSLSSISIQFMQGQVTEDKHDTINAVFIPSSILLGFHSHCLGTVHTVQMISRPPDKTSRKASHDLTKFIKLISRSLFLSLLCFSL